MAKTAHVAYIGPAPETSSYWKNLLAPLPAVAKQLNLTISFHHPEHNNRFLIVPLAQALINSNNKPDYIISVFRNNNAQPLLALVEKHKIPLITLSTGVPRLEQKQVGTPQQNYKYWFAQILSDDLSSGQVLAQKLIEYRRNKVPNKQVKLAAIGGNNVFEASRLRDAGLKQVIKTNPDVDFLQLVHSNWDEQTTKRMTKQLIKRHEQIDAIWAANTDIALTVNKIYTEKLPHQEHPDIAAVDWTKAGFIAIQQEKIAFSLGSNHFIGVWALILFHDITHGIPLSVSEPPTFTTPYILADKNNIDKIEPYLEGKYWQDVNIKIYSKVFNQQLKKYNFDFNLLLKKSSH